jgi:hypothetical protein
VWGFGFRRTGVCCFGDPLPRFASSPTPPAGGGVYMVLGYSVSGAHYPFHETEI